MDSTPTQCASHEAPGAYRAMAMPSQGGLDGGVCA